MGIVQLELVLIEHYASPNPGILSCYVVMPSRSSNVEIRCSLTDTVHLYCGGVIIIKLSMCLAKLFHALVQHCLRHSRPSDAKARVLRGKHRLRSIVSPSL
jgi:hypothetical protein